MKSRFLLAFLLFCALCVRALPAQDEGIPETYQEDAKRYTSRTKLQRGLTNSVTGWLELPYNVFSEVVFGTRTPFVGLVTGVVLGTGKTIQRTGIGLFETATFYIPNYDPIMKPEFVTLSFGSSTSEDFGDPKEGLHVRPPTGFQE